MRRKKEFFFGKIMLFGEYGVMLGSSALTMPLENYYGKWAFTEETTASEYISKSRNYLSGLLEYLSNQKVINHQLQLEMFQDEIQHGLYFESNIPVEYGVGSSGALVAAVYARYANEPQTDLDELKKTLALMENHFHGQSSGIDPLSCYIGKPIHIDKQGIRLIENKLTVPDEKAGIFLIDTKTTGKTGALVDHFKDQLTHYSFFKKVRDVMITETNNCVDAMLKRQFDNLYSALHKLSEFQYTFMQPMIPAAFLPLWKKGLDQGDLLLKLCGSGGGGFLLGFARDKSSVIEGVQLEGISP